MRKIAFLMSSASTGRLTGELARREKILRSIASPETRIDIFGLDESKAPEVNDILSRVSKILTSTFHTHTGPYDRDPAYGIPPCQPSRTLRSWPD